MDKRINLQPTTRTTQPVNERFLYNNKSIIMNTEQDDLNL